MAFPPAHFLVGCGMAELTRTVAPVPRWRSWLLAGALAVSPDFDFIIGLVAGRAYEYHGTFTHSVFAAVVVGAAIALAVGWRWGLVGAAGYGSHLLVDLLDDRGRTNVLLAWPFSDKQPFAIARLFPTIPFDQSGGMRRAALSLLEPEVFRALTIQTLVGAGLLLLLLGAALVLRRALAAGGRRPVSA